MANPKNRSEFSDTPSATVAQHGKSEGDIENRIRELLGVRDFKWLAAQTGISVSTLYDFGKRGGKTETAVRVAEALRTSVDFLLRGDGSRRSAKLMDANDAEWLMLPRYDLRAFAVDGKPEPVETIPIPRPWLRGFDTPSTGLWITALPVPLPGIAGEGDPVVCRDADADLIDGRTYIFMRDQSPLIRRVAIDSQGFSLLATDTAMPTIQLGRRDPPSPDEQIVPIARIVGLLGLRGI